MASVPADPHHFRLKGKQAEEVLELLGRHTFLEDWCYPNPRLANKKELCDFLVVFDRVALIWQVKNLKLRADGQYSPSETAKNLRQLVGARRQLIDLRDPVRLRNPRRGNETFDAREISEVFLLSVLAGEGEGFSTPMQLFKGHVIHTFSAEFAEKALTSLDTIGDFIAYLRAKEALLKSLGGLIIQGGEEELLALYLLRGRSFDQFRDTTHVIVDEGHWSSLLGRPEYAAKREADKPSYLWDHLIDQVHACSDPRYERVAREMARHTRFERRYLAKVFMSAQMRADEGTKNVFRRTIPFQDRTYCFLFFEPPAGRNEEEAAKVRAYLLAQLCSAARVTVADSPLVIGIATEKCLSGPRSFDFCLLDNPQPTGDEVEKTKAMMRETGLFRDVTVSRFQETEYPSPRAAKSRSENPPRE